MELTAKVNVHKQNRWYESDKKIFTTSKSVTDFRVSVRPNECECFCVYLFVYLCIVFGVYSCVCVWVFFLFWLSTVWSCDDPKITSIMTMHRLQIRSTFLLLLFFFFLLYGWICFLLASKYNMHHHLRVLFCYLFIHKNAKKIAIAWNIAFYVWVWWLMFDSTRFQRKNTNKIRNYSRMMAFVTWFPSTPFGARHQPIYTCICYVIHTH